MLKVLFSLLLLTVPSLVKGHDYFMLQVQSSNLCLHQHGATQENGGNITQWRCGDAPNIKIEKILVGLGPPQTYYLKFKHSEKCVHVHGTSSANGTNITQWSCIREPNVLWILDKVDPDADSRFAYYYVRSYRDPSKCLHQHGASLVWGDNITLWDCVDQPNVQWRFLELLN